MFWIVFILFTVVYDILISLAYILINTDGREHEGVNGLPRGMKSYPKQFSRLPYYEHLLIVHLFDTMHIINNVAETLCWILNGRSDKYFFFKICSDIQEANHAMKYIIEYLNNDGDQINIRSLPWLLTEQQSNVVKEVIQKNEISHKILFQHKEYLNKERWFWRGKNAFLSYLH